MKRIARRYNAPGGESLGVLMPIRFRCTACGGVLSIARRKAGSNVLCPKCAVTLVVPGASTVPDPEKVEVPVRGAVAGEPVITGRAVGPNGKKIQRPSSKPAEDPPLFERLDFESLLQPAADKARQKQAPKTDAPLVAKSPPTPKPAPPPPTPARFTPRPEQKPDREKPAPTPAHTHIQITRVQLIAIVVLVFCLVGMGVGVGYALGRS